MAEYNDFGTQVNPEFLSDQTANPVAEYLAKFWRKITPTQRTPGGLLASSYPSTPINPAELADPTGGGALPPARPPKVVRPPIGAFAAVPVMQETAETPGAREAGLAFDTAPTPAVPASAAPATAAAPTASMRDEFVKRLAGMDKTQKTGMTDEQKGLALMEAGLAIMAAASKPGASAVGAVGTGGQHGTAVAREMERINREQADKLRSEDRANLRDEFTLAGQDIDRADRKEDKAENRRIREEDLTERSMDRKYRNATENRRIDLLGQQVEAAGWQIKDGADGMVHAYNVRTGEDRKTPLKVKPERNQNIEFYSWMLKTPGAKELFTKSDAVDMKDEGKLRALYGQAYLKASIDPMGDISKFPTFDEWRSKIEPGGARKEAPPAAVDMLRKNPALKDAFKQKYGYLPAGL